MICTIGEIDKSRCIKRFPSAAALGLGCCSLCGQYRCIDNELLMVFRADKKQLREVYLNEPVGSDKEGNEITLLDILESEKEDIVENLVFSENVKRMYDAVRGLPEPEKTILAARYGLGGHKQKTQREIAENLGISRSYVSRIEKRAVEKLREKFTN